MDNVLNASMDVLDIVKCNIPCVCENAPVSVNPYNCDDMLHESMDVVDISNVKHLKKKAKKFEYLNMDLDAKLVLFDRLVDDLKYENESLKMHAKGLITELTAKNEENLCCNQVVLPNFMPSVSSTFKYKSMYIPPHKRNQKMERKSFKPKPFFRSLPKEFNGSKFVPICHHCSVIGHIRSQCFMLKREQNHVPRSLPKKPSGPKLIVCHYCGGFGHLRPHCSKFQALKRIKRKAKFEFLGSCALQAKPDLEENGKLLKKVFDVLTSLSMSISSSHSSNHRVTFQETLIPNNHSV